MSNVFDLLHEEVRDLVRERFQNPTPIQRMVIPRVMESHDVLILSETGSGKTESALLPIFDRMQRGSLKPISTLYITPLRSLNRDLLKRILWWSRKLDFDVSVRHGDTSQYERSMQAQNPPDLMISTPETLQAILTGKLMRSHLANIKFIVIDEVHELVSSKRGVQLAIGLERLKKLILAGGGKPPQIVCLSATVGNPEEVAAYFMTNAHIVNTERGSKVSILVEAPASKGETSETRAFMSEESKKRLDYMASTVGERNSVLIFTNTREAAERLSSRLKALNPNLPLQTHHSSLSREVRMKAEDDFKSGKLKALLCTSSLELGIDIGLVDFIIQYNSPRQVSKMLQRVGRAGHTLDRTSEGVIITTGVDDAFESAVIARLAMEGRIEPSRIYGKSLDVLAHQSTGMAMETWKVPLKDVKDIIRRSKPFHNLARKELIDTALVLQRAGYTWLNYISKDKEILKKDEIFSHAKEKGFFDRLVLKRRKQAFQYYFENLTTIPDVKNYKVFDIASRQNVGTLDAEFISLHGGPGAEFIVNGQGWRMLEIMPKKILVEPLLSFEAAIPAWEGELIPVPFEVAQEVGRLREEIRKKGKAALKDYPVSEEVARRMVKAIKKQGKELPIHDTLLMEYGLLEGDPYLVIHSCFGSLVNETLGRAVSSLLASRFGSIGLKTDPYRIVFRLADLTQWRDVADIFSGLKPDIMKEVLALTLPNTDLFRWRFSHVARRFGVISREADVGKPYLKKLIEVYRGTPVFKETLNEIFQEKLDLEKASEVLELLEKGKIKIRENNSLSYLSRLGILKRYELVGEPKPEKEVFSIFKQRLLGTKIALLCTHCASLVYMGTVEEADRFQCKKCKSRLLGLVHWKRANDAVRLLQRHLDKKPMTSEEKEAVDRILATSYLIVASGADAVRVLAGRGVGPATASRILARMTKDDDLLRDVLEAEKRFAKTRRFWQDR